MSATSFARYPSLAGRGVLITGGASGIGATLVEEFAAQGARVAFIDIDRASAGALAATLAQSPAAAPYPPLFIAADVTDIAALEAAIDAARRHVGPITVLLNNAADDRRQGIDAITSESWDAAVAVNLKHQFFAARSVAADMTLVGGGSIVNFGSISWRLKMSQLPVYATSKAAVQGLTRSLAREFGPYKIRVNTLVPGWVMTDKQVRLWLDEEGRAAVARGQCLGGPLLATHIAHMALFLASDDSAMCTAQDFVVDAGWT